MLNSDAFRGAMAAQGYNQKRLAKQLNMSENALSLKIRGKSSFTLNEVQAICKMLKIVEPAEKCKIFLP